MISRRIALRTDASAHIGTGHFMRCLTLADALYAKGFQTRFICRQLANHMREIAVARGHEVELLDDAPDGAGLDQLQHSGWLGVSQQRDAADSLRALDEPGWDWMIVDHYALDFRWESIVREKLPRIMVVDDIADRRHDCDLLLDQNYYADMHTRYVDKLPTDCQQLLGPKYALLRDEFRLLHERARVRDGVVGNILVFFGGVDAGNYTACAIEALAGIDFPNLMVDVVVGKQHPRSAQIEAACRKYGFTYHMQTDKMAELMATADLALGAGGSASWERCCLGLPALLVATADNQVNIAKALHEVGACAYIENLEAGEIGRMSEALKKLLVSPQKLQLISQKSHELVDGRGVSRVCRMLGY